MCIVRITKKGGGREYVGGKNMQHVSFFAKIPFDCIKKVVCLLVKVLQLILPS